MNETADYDGMTTAERIRLAEQVYVAHPRIEAMYARIEHCRSSSKYAAEPECLLIQGETGAGKTTLLRRYEQDFPRFDTKDGTTVPVLSTTIPVPATVKSLATKLLIKLGDPLAEKGTVVTQTLRLYRLLRACEVEIIILDEFQHFIDRDSKKILETVSDWLKDLLNETGIPVVLIGMPTSEQVLNANKQLQRRFAVRERLDTFGWETGEERSYFRKFLKMLDNQLPLKERSHLSDTDIAYRFYCASDGVVAYVMKLVRRAVALALHEGKERLTLDVLARAYAERRAADVPHLKNPFLVEI